MEKIDFQKRRLLLKLRFDGTNYCGWQVQQNGITIQETLQNAIEAVTGVRSGVIGCSRTDSGVHAAMFCCSFDTVSAISQSGFIKALNANLPSDIAVFDCEAVKEDFHPRYRAKEKEYEYHIYNSAVRNPFNSLYSYHIFKKLDVEAMEIAAKAFVGRHDFSAFCSAGCSVEDKIRTITKSEISFVNNEIIYSVCADGFLYNMVRIIAGTLIEVGMGKIHPGDISKIIKSGDRGQAGATAPPHGLFLNQVFY